MEHEAREGEVNVDSFQQIGADLNSARLERGIQINELSQLLRISKTYLKDIEAGDFEALPGPTYVAGYLRSFAREVGLDAVVLQQRYRALLVQGEDRPAYSFPVDHQRPQRSGAMMASFIVIFAVAGYGGWYALGKPDILTALTGESQTETATLPQVESTMTEPDDMSNPEGGPVDLAAPITTEMAATETGATGTGATQTGATETIATETQTAATETVETPGLEVVVPPVSNAVPDNAVPDNAVPDNAVPDTVAPETGLAARPAIDADNPATPPVGASGDAAPAALVASAPSVPAAETVSSVAANPTDLAAAGSAVDGSTASTIVAPAGAAPDMVGSEVAGPAIAGPAVAGPGIADSDDNMVTATAGSAEMPDAMNGQIAAGNGQIGSGQISTGVAYARQRVPDMEVTLRATGASWVEIIRNDGEEVMAKLMRAGDTYLVDSRDRLYLSTGNAGGLELVFDDGTVRAVGDSGEILRDLLLDAAKLRNQF